MRNLTLNSATSLAYSPPLGSSPRRMVICFPLNSRVRPRCNNVEPIQSSGHAADLQDVAPCICHQHLKHALGRRHSASPLDLAEVQADIMRFDARQSPQHLRCRAYKTYRLSYDAYLHLKHEEGSTTYSCVVASALHDLQLSFETPAIDSLCVQAETISPIL